MDFFFVEYRDPLVGLILLTILILVVALSHFIWKIFASKDEEERLGRFIKKFELDTAHQDLLRSNALSISNLIFLADIFTKSGEFEKATQIYLISLEKTKDKNEQEMIFLSLAKVYFKAGFLERSKEVLLNALKIRPRNIEALKLLKIVYLRLRMYKENLELLECLFELGIDIKDEQEFFKALIIEATSLNPSKEAFLHLNYQNNTMLKRWLFEKYKLYLEQDFESIIDLLYKNNSYLQTKDFNFEEFFYALNLSDKEVVFKDSNLKMLHILNTHNFKARLEFSYLCLECKSILPLFFYHCPMCYEFNKCKIICEVKNDERD
ncbi:hypothetical protein FMM56_05375 [Campylobacter sp. LR264d]|uniref:tetratricopeptide repeat protein n=1 Tax=Campylobacter sp. LR264d TaxID=2593544 RepID=UPI00123B6965|nr:hypothetical protein [Campylobacter sp. LR264d]KAA6231118.1 hypothetical protein FMM56_05375 [Campylobacter sp. LR264d]